MNSCTQTIDIPKNKYYQETNTYPETTVYKINGTIVNKQIFYIIRQLCCEHNVSMQEIERLNNIINELETWINSVKTFDDICVYEDYSGRWGIQPKYILDKLKELKESANNE